MILGMSFATVIGLIDILLQQTFNFFFKYVGKLKKIANDILNQVRVPIDNAAYLV